jgi:hypothetical protein
MGQMNGSVSLFAIRGIRVGTAKRSGLKLSEFKSPQKGNFLI